MERAGLRAPALFLVRHSHQEWNVTTTTIGTSSPGSLPRGAWALPAAGVERLRAADLILHAGDFVARSAYSTSSAWSAAAVFTHVSVTETERPPSAV